MATVCTASAGNWVVYEKGASERVLDKCSKYLDANGNEQQLDDSVKESVGGTIRTYAGNAFRTLTLAYKYADANSDFVDDEREPILENIEDQLVLLCVVAIEDPIREAVPKAVSTCQEAGITIRMVTGDNIDTAQSIAKRCGILRPGYAKHSADDYTILEGPEFKNLVGGLVTKRQNDKEFKVVKDLDVFKKVVASLRVMARSEPEHKFILVTGLRQLGEVVAVTGDGTNDAPALKKANVGFAMNIAGTQLAKEASDIILLDDNFASTVTAVKWGRNIYDCIRKFIQFQVTVNIVALVLAFVGACILKESPLTAVQMLWVNLIMDTFAALALATEPPNDELLKRAPQSPEESLITTEMFKMVVGFAFYQVVWLLVILFIPEPIFGVSPKHAGDKWSEENGVHYTIFFNTFVFLQVFNEINCRKLSSKEYNVFKGFFNNLLFLLILLFTIVVQVLLVEFGGEIFACSGLNWKHHLICLGIGVGGLIWNLIVRLIPNTPFKCLKFSDEPMRARQARWTLTAFLRRPTTRALPSTVQSR